MKTDNELIAEFMGWKKIVNTDIYYLRTDKGASKDELFFDVSWDWLMPVVHKILKTTEPTNEGWSYEYLELEKTRVGNSIDYVYMKVVGFIKWYNSQRDGGN